MDEGSAQFFPGVRNDGVIVTSVKMPFTEEDKHVRKKAVHFSRRLLKEFSTKSGLCVV